MSKGWYQHPYEHGLAARGIVTQKYRKKFPTLVKPFRGQNPRLTDKYARFRQEAPTRFVAGSFRTKRVSPESAVVVAKRKRDQKFSVQSVLVNREKYFAVKFVEKGGKIHATRSGEEVKQLATTVANGIRPFASRVAVTGSIRRNVSSPTDVDLVAVPKGSDGHEKIREYLRARSTEIYADGPEKFSGRIGGVKTEVVFSSPDEYGAQLLTATGPRGANIYHRRVAKEKGMTLSQHGLFKGNRRIAVTEEGIYRALGSTYRRPELRGQPR